MKKQNLILLFLMTTFFFLDAQVTVQPNQVGINVTPDPRYGLYSISNSTASSNTGVIGEGLTPSIGSGSAFGVRGIVPAGSGFTYGVTGSSTTSTPSNAGRAFGVRGIASNATPGFNYAIYGDLQGSNEGAAILGYDRINNAGANENVNGFWAGYFIGNAYVSDSLGIGRVPMDYEFEVNGDAGKTNGGSTWQILSDQRLKKDVSDFNDGLEVLTQIRPVWFKYNGKAGTNSNTQEIGILAQEMEKIAPYMIGNYTYKAEDGKKTDYRSYNANALFYILVNSVQEQQTTIETLETENEDLKTRLERLENAMAQLLENRDATIEQQNIKVSNAQLQQNEPNPFQNSTTIRYFIPEQVQTAEMRISDANGKIVKTVVIDARGQAQSNLQTDFLSAGNYFYTLVLDGQVLETKQMLLTK